VPQQLLSCSWQLLASLQGLQALLVLVLLA
jgi:hypothetical protein